MQTHSCDQRLVFNVTASAQPPAAVHRKACSKYSSTVNCNLTQHQAIELLKLDDTSQHAHLHYRH